MKKNPGEEAANADDPVVVIDDGFAITKGSNSEFEYWILVFNSLHDKITIDKYSDGNIVEFMDLFIYTGEKLRKQGNLMFLFFKRKIINAFTSQQKVVMLNIPLKISS